MPKKIELQLIEPSVGEAILRIGELWYLVSMDYDWKPVKLPAVGAVVRWVHFANARATVREYLSIEEAVGDIRRTCLGAFDVPKVDRSKANHLIIKLGIQSQSSKRDYSYPPYAPERKYHPDSEESYDSSLGDEYLSSRGEEWERDPRRESVYFSLKEVEDSRYVGGGGVYRSFAGVEAAVERFQAGNSPEEAFRVLFSYYDPVLRRLFGRRGAPLEDCRDLTQRTLFQVYKSLHEFRRESSFHTWIHRIALNFYRRWKREKRSKSGREIEIVSLDTATRSTPYLEQEDPAPSPLDTAMLHERKRNLRRALHSLPEKQLQCFVLHTYHELSYREIAAVMQIRVGEVGIVLKLARANMAKALKDD
jgi:RNA polymerase sigma-70 factor (ECF subfamily)